ncbi:16357_t:CDS:2 [Acaulospora morrowiae]|uniref:16357_t:CDS:1 n=1 Tax=Acaulospora morrowiae TaxID=94023 RepID=A0A9N9BK28_9GLOM|nr:16357_t:CDS:2 [Acaulospora morrowiae]
MTEYMEHTNESSNIANNPDNGDDTEDVPKKFLTSLKLLPKFYSWILKTFGADADTTKACFDDILRTRVSINEQLIKDLNSELPPNGWTKCSYKATVNIWKIFFLGPLFKGFLPKLFKMESTMTYYLSVEDPNNQEDNDQNAEGQHEETSVNITLPID